MKLLIDMNLTPRWSSWLAGHDIEAVHWSEVGPQDAPDTEIMKYAAENDFIVFTHDLDFSAILSATGGQKPSVVQLRGPEIRPEIIGPVLVRALQSGAVDLDAGALLTIDAKRSRLRILPLLTN